MPEKQYDPQEPLAITLTMRQWQTVQLCLECYALDQHAKRTWWETCCADGRMGAETAARYEVGAKAAEEITAKIVAAIMEETTNEATES